MSSLTQLKRSLLPGNELRWPVNDPKQWHHFGDTPACDLEAFQRKINDLVGVTLSNQPIVRIVDAQKALRWEAGHWRLRYRYYQHRLDTPEGVKFLDFAPPRYLLEERIEPAQFLPSWEAARYQGEGHDRVDVLGEPPEALYQPFWDVVEHAHGCCERYPKLKCWGLFRQPGGKELEMLRSCQRDMQRDDFYQSPHEPLSARVLAQIALESHNYAQAEDDEKLNRWREFWENEYAIWGWRDSRVETDPTRLRHGKYFFTRRTNGLFTPASHLN